MAKRESFLLANSMHHPNADYERMYEPRSEEGRGLVQQESSYKRQKMVFKDT